MNSRKPVGENMIHEEVDKIIQEIIEEDATWKKCYPCQNHGICCDGASIIISSEEHKKIEKFLREHNEVFLYAKSQKEKNKLCLFYNPDAHQCLIHDIRPLICRVTPMKGHATRDSKSIEVYVPKSGHNCNDMSRVLKNISRREGRKIYTEDGHIYFNIDQIFADQEAVLKINELPIFS